MFRSLIVFLVTALMTTGSSVGTLPEEAHNLANVSVYSSEDLTREILEERKEKGEVIVEKIVGIVEDEEGNGKVLNVAEGAEEFDYISYRGVPGAEKGDVVITFCVYSVDNNAIDDIVYRYDVVLTK